MGTLVKSRTRAASSPRSGGAKFEYTPRTAEEVRRRASQRIGGKDSFFDGAVEFFTPREGDNTVRILPPPLDAGWGHYGMSVVAHYEIGPDKAAFLCLDKMKGEPCPICEERVAASSAGEDEFADKLRPAYRTLMYVIDRNQEGKGPMIYTISASRDSEILKVSIDPTTGEALPVDDPNDGYDFSFSRKGLGLKTKYSGEQFARKESPLSDDVETAQAWLDHARSEHRLDKILKVHDYDYIKKVLEGQSPTTAEPKPDKEDPPARGGKPAKQDAESAEGKPRIQPRTKRGEEEQAQTPTWAELQELDEDGMSAVIDEFKLDPPAEGFDDIEHLRTWIAEELKIEEPAQEKPAAAAGKGSWKDKLRGKK